MDAADQSSRGVVEVSGPDARALLQRLITNDVEALQPGQGRYAALLTPQGKIVADFFVVSSPTAAEPERFLLDCPGALAADLARKLSLYRLRAKVLIADRSADLDAAALAQEIAPGDLGVTIFADPRDAALGFRVIGPRDIVATLRAHAADAETTRIGAGVPQGGVDFPYGDTFPHEANLDRLHGVDFSKGCYVGQEVVSRMQHRSTTRKRVVPITFEGEAPTRGAEIRAGEQPVGTVGSSAGQRGLALVRIDRVAEAATPLMALGRPIQVELP